MNVNGVLIFAIVIAVLTVVNTCLFAAICAARDKCKDYYSRCNRILDLYIEHESRCRTLESNCARYSGILEGFLKGKEIETDA